MTDSLKSKEDFDRVAKDNWQFAHRCDCEGKEVFAQAARDRAIEYEKCRDSWLYRTLGL